MRVLSVRSGPSAGQTREIDGEILVGREDADLTIADDGISRRHVLVRPVPEGVVVQDLGSLNGTHVNGERIARPVTLTSSATILVGNSEIDVEIDVAGATVVGTQRLVRREQDTVPVGIGERTGYVRPVTPDPPVVPQRPAAATPSVEVPSRAASRPSPVIPPTGPPPRSRRLLKWGAPVALLAVAAAVGVGVVLAAGGDEPKARKLTSNLTTALLKQTATRVTFGGTANQTPGGHGLVEGKLRLKGDLTKGKPVPLTATMVFRFEGGRINATVTGNAIPQPDKTVNLVGTGKITGGTDEFEGATGSFKFRSGQEAANPTIGHPKIRGTIKY